MTKEKSTVPRLRFPGFTTTWKQRKLGEVGYAKSGVGFPEKEQGGTTGIPFFKVSDMNTNGNENELVVANNYVTDEQISKRKWRVITEVPAIFFAKVGAAVMLNRKRLIRHPFLLDNNTMTYVFNHTQWDTNFGKTLFETIDLIQLTQVGALPSYNSSDVENINISLPTLPEQEAIGSFFSDLDQLITLHQRKLDDVKELKKALLQKMFPKGNGNDFPELRFPEFTDAWKQRKLGEVGYAKSGVGFPEKEQGGTTGIPFFKVSDMNTNGNENELVVANNYVTDEQISKRKWRVITEVPAIFFAKVGAAVMLNRKRLIRHPFLLDNNTMTYVFNHTQWDTNFGKTLFETIDLIQLTQVGALPSYNSSDVENINISLPTLPEQEAIGSFFSDLDQLITLHQRQLDHLKLLKKALLQQMFI